MNSSGTLESVNPATGQILGIVPVTSPAQIKESFSKARSAAQQWSQQTLAERLDLLSRFRKLLLKKRKSISALISAEAGKPLAESLTEVFAVLETCNWLQKETGKLLKPESLRLNRLFFRSKKTQTVFEPLGTIAVISPWNFPFSIPATSVLTALVTGNTVVLKPSPKTPLLAEALRDLLHEAGLPDDVLHLIHGDKAEARLVMEEGPDRVIFTGSVAGGKAILQLAAQTMTAVTPELGGKHAAIVLEDADLEKCADALVWSAFSNSGQACASIERLYVVESKHDELLALLRKKTAALRLGDPSKPNTDMGPLIDVAALTRVRSMIQRACQQGATVAFGGRSLCDIDAKLAATLTGAYLEPTILTDVRQDMQIVKDEIFGPVLPVIKVRNRSEALACANDSSYGLGASIWSADIAAAEALASRIKCGMVWINDGLFSHACPEAPWGGTKYSGFGRTHGKHSVLDFVNIKLVSTDKPGKRDWNFPYSKKQLSLIDAATCTINSSTICGRFFSSLRLAFAWLITRW